MQGLVKSTGALIQIYQCLCDETRLRILNALSTGSLCVCHLQELLEEPQVKISKHLGYLRDRGIVEVERHQNWMIYSLPAKPSVELESNLKCLQDCAHTYPVFRADLHHLRKMRKELGWLDSLCCGEKGGKRQ